MPARQPAVLTLMINQIDSLEKSLTGQMHDVRVELSERMVIGNALHLPLAAGTVQCCVTSPPYWGLRDYGTARWEGGEPNCQHDPRRRERDAASKQAASGGSPRDSLAGRDFCRLCGARRIDRQLGLESTPDAYVAQMVAVFREVWRVLRDDGTLWLNLGSSYFGSRGGDTHGGFNERYFGKQFAGDKQSRTPFPVSDDRKPIRSRDDVLACGTDGRELQDSMGADSFCSGLCDGCLADFLSHLDRIADIGRQTAQSDSPRSQTDHDTGPQDCVASSPASSLPDVPVSTTLESWRRHRGACSRCDSRASALSGLRSYDDASPAFSRRTWLDYTIRLKQKDMVPIPWMIAMALQADGWYLRQDIIWAKPNPMPESVRDRCTKAHEYLFLLTKSQRYYYDAEAIAEPSVGEPPISRMLNHSGTKRAQIQSLAESTLGTPADRIRNRRSVWTVNTQPYAGAHFAVMPEKLVEPCVLAGSKPGDLVLDPFAGSGTVGVVCRRFARRFVGVDLNPTYVGMEMARIRGEHPGLPLEAIA